MIGSSRVGSIKRAQKESALYRLISGLMHQAVVENKALDGLWINRVELSPGKTICTVYFYTVQGPEHFRELLEDLKLLKPSLRKAIAHEINARYTVDLIFKFDDQFEKTQRIERLIESLKEPSTVEADSSGDNS